MGYYTTKRSDRAAGFTVLPKRWIVERTIAWLNRCRRLPDTISVRFIALEAGKATLAIYSRSQIGHSDLGVNEARVLRWLSLLKAGADTR